jgi:hypothetical protein
MLLVVVRDTPIQAYTITLPANFLTLYATSAWSTNNAVSYVSGNCMPSNDTPQMMSYIGYTSTGGVFFFRDNGSNDALFGLFADGFGLNGGGCAYSGGLHGQHGEIYVR